MQDKQTEQLVGQMFALVTALFEDGAALALEGQVPRLESVPDLARELQAYARDISLLLETAELICRMVD